MELKHYSLEERLVEPFRSIQWISLSRAKVVLSLIFLLVFDLSWWFLSETVLDFWAQILLYFTQITHNTWTIQTGYWPNHLHPLILLPKVIVPILAPSRAIWWSFAFATISLWFLTGQIRLSLLPLRSFTRFILFLIWIALACFAISPFAFRHSIEVWSKIYFLASYGFIFFYSAIWTIGVLWMPIATGAKIRITLLLILYELIGTPILFFLSTLVLQYSSLLLLPVFALAFAPLIQLGWFVSFYSLALSNGSVRNKENQF